MNTPENLPDCTRWRALINRHLLGELSTEEALELESSLAAHREAREDFLLRCNLDTALRKEATAFVEDSAPGAIGPSEQDKSTTGRPHSLSWRSLSATAAGLVFGLFSASIVWAYAVPGTKRSVDRVVSVLAEGFEKADESPKRGFPTVANEWFGDLSAPVPTEVGMMPVEGTRMTRLMSYSTRKFCYAWRILDLAELPLPVAGETRRMEVSASFNAPGPARPLRYQARLAAFSQEPGAIRQIWNNEPVLFDTVLQHVGRNLHAGAEDRSWQTVRATMEIPPGTRTVVISLGASEGEPDTAPQSYYLDDVRVRLISRDAFQP